MQSDPNKVGLLIKILPEGNSVEEVPLTKDGIIIDGQATALAHGLIKEKTKLGEPLFKDDYTNEMITADEYLKRASQKDNKHPYDDMCLKACQQFPRCKNEIIAFFQHENIRNTERMREIEQMPGGATSYANARSVEWLQFWTGIRTLELDRYNEEIATKKREKNERKGRPTGPKPIKFDGPTYSRTERKST